MRAQEADAGGLASGDTHDLRAIIAAQVSPPFFSPSLAPSTVIPTPLCTLCLQCAHLLSLSLLQCASVPGCAAGRVRHGEELDESVRQAKEIEYLKGMGSLSSQSASSGRTSGLGKVRFDSVADMNPSSTASAPVTPTSSARSSHPTDFDGSDYAGLSLSSVSVRESVRKSMRKSARESVIECGGWKHLYLERELVVRTRHTTDH
jgi:hypothetical protein